LTKSGLATTPASENVRTVRGHPRPWKTSEN